MHLLTGRYFRSDGSIPFFVGTVAPDCVGERELKDRTHLRDRNDRHEAIIELKNGMDLCDDYQLGALLHLYTDMLWDEGPQKAYKDSYPEPDNAWFRPYRNEISLASSYIFHRSDWGEQLWRDMLECPDEHFDSLADFPAEAIRGYLTRNFKWHYENDVGPSAVYTPEAVDEFCRGAAKSFLQFLNQ